MIDPDDLSQRMIHAVNDGLAGVSSTALEEIGYRLRLAKSNPAAYRVGVMLLELVAINREYAGGHLVETITELR
jgi:hypothetical protein